MQYRIQCIQTVFGEERERRLKRAFDIIWNLDIQKLREGGTRSKGCDPDSSAVTVSTNETEVEAKEGENLLQILSGNVNN